MRFTFAAILGAHGIAHLVGFVVPWRLMSVAELPYRTTILAGRLDVGDGGIRIVGLLWLVAAVGMLGSAVAWATALDSAFYATMVAIFLSAALCLIEWPEARIGLFVNVALVLFLLLRARFAISLRS